MPDFIKNIHIKNFKSIRECELTSCERINLFIGRPNVGKSNIIEALSLFSVPYLKENTSKKLSGLVRIENETELFYNGRSEYEAKILTNLGACSLHYNPKTGLNISLNTDGDLYTAKVDNKLNVTRAVNTSDGFDSRIKRYTYRQDVTYRSGHAKYLIPPSGYNLLSIIENYRDLKEEVADLLGGYQYEIIFDRASQTIKFLYRGKNDAFLLPYNSVADTLQRVIFYKAAIASNTNSILLFEEPEAHAFPPYMTQLTQEMIYKNDNQYFLATHSPFILNDLLENAANELAVFVVHRENSSSTQVKQLTKDELHEAYQSGVDFFTNSESFIG